MRPHEDAIWELAAEGGMAALTVENLRRKLSCSPSVLSALYPEPGFMVLLLIEQIHRQALEVKGDTSLSLHDRLTETVMTHFDAALPHRPAVARLWDDLMLKPITLIMLRPYVVKMVKRILQARGAETENSLNDQGNDLWNGVRTSAYMCLFLYVLRVWIYDGSPHQEKTLTALDKGLKNLSRLTW